MGERLASFIDKHILPWPVRILTHRLIILITILSIVPLITYKNNITFVLVVNSYLNVMAVAVSSIVLKFSIKEEEEHAKADEKRDNAQFKLLREINERIIVLESKASKRGARRPVRRHKLL